MEAKKAFSTARLLVLGDIVLVTLTILTGFVFTITPANALKSMYNAGDKVSSFFSIVIFGSLIPLIIAWTLILCRKKTAIIFYGLSIFLAYSPTFFFIWVVNGIENVCGTLRLLISGAIIFLLLTTKFEPKEKSKTKEKDVSDSDRETKVGMLIDEMMEDSEGEVPPDKK